MNFLERTDALILSFFTKISHKFQQATGQTNFFLAKCCIFLLGLSLCIHLINFFVRILNQETDIFLLSVMVVMGILLNKHLSLCEKEDKNLKNSIEKPTKNPREIGLFSLRIITIFICFFTVNYYNLVKELSQPKVSLIFEILNHGFSPVYCSYLYFISVTLLPPGKSRIREWIESFGKVPVPVPVRSRR